MSSDFDKRRPAKGLIGLGDVIQLKDYNLVPGVGEADNSQWVELDEHHHTGVALVVWKMENDERTPECEERARRLVACWNACVNVSTDWLEANAPALLIGNPLKSRFDVLLAERDTLAARVAELTCQIDRAEEAMVERDVLASKLKASEMQEPVRTRNWRVWGDTKVQPPKQRHPWPNHNFCVGCTGETCMGCGTEPQERRKTSAVPVKLQFPTALRKMWSGGEVQDWLDAQGPLYSRPVSALPVEQRAPGAHPALAAPYGPVKWTEADREKLRDTLAEALGDSTYCCTRVWNAWNVGTMGPDDFVLAAEDDDVLDDLTAAALLVVAGGSTSESQS